MAAHDVTQSAASNQYHVKPAAHCCMPYLTLVVLLLHAVYCAAVVAAGPRLKLDPHEMYRLPSGFVRLGLPLAKGAFGTVLWGTGPDGQRLVAKRAAATAALRQLLKQSQSSPRETKVLASSRGGGWHANRDQLNAAAWDGRRGGSRTRERAGRGGCGWRPRDREVPKTRAMPNLESC